VLTEITFGIFKRHGWTALCCTAAIVVVVAIGTPAVAGEAKPDPVPVITVGDHLLLPNTPDQQFPVYISGGQQVAIVNFFIQVADGGPEAANYGLIPPPGVSAPHITDVDLITGTIFEQNNDGHVGAGTPEIPQFFDRGVMTEIDSVPAEGLLGTVTVDTTDFYSGTWPLDMENSIEGTPTYFSVTGSDMIVPQFIGGSITIVPEPSIILLLVAGLAALSIWRFRPTKR